MRRYRDWLACFAPAVPWLLTAFLIVAVLLILVSALRPKAHAQFGGVQQPMFGMASTAAAPWQPTNEPSAVLWWVASDLPTGGYVTNWLDRIQSFQLSQTNTGRIPTNTTTGVYFDPVAGYYLTNRVEDGINGHYSGWVATSNLTILAILTPITPLSDFSGLIQADGNYGYTGGHGLFVRTTGVFYWERTGSGTFPYTSGQEMDIAVAAWGTSGGGSIFYTNGVQQGTSAANGLYGDAIGVVGALIANGWYYKGYIREMLWCTNIVSSANISNYHHYATNLYGYTP